ncbi:hypothetical protein KUTeg_014296 [Tegillarca granosa]|uniref:Sulfotransferase domain-containing protein n=1 Tax=Tegillarca granosa TaxID=220873 RepID=A0ABQ9EZN0_TEGGR|nr:hypothetical protein KUTeg_014296 [Tegillarca granosa]
MDAGVYQNGDISESDVTQVTDPSGNCMKFIGYDGEYLSAEGVRLGQFPDPRINIPQIKEMEVKENDIFINAYPKAGTHWVWEISKMLLKGKAEYEEAIKETAMIEFNSPEMLQKLPPPRVFNSHLYFRNLPRDIIKKKCKIIFVNRNPKDICVSYYHHCVHCSSVEWR